MTDHNHTSEEPESQKERVFYVEDDKNIREIVRFSLEREGHSIDIATDGREASTYINEQPPPTVILLDVMLPYKDGFELLEEIQDKPSWESVPILMLTARDEEDDLLRALDEGVKDYIKKPFNPKELVARIQRYFDNEA